MRKNVASLSLVMQGVFEVILRVIEIVAKDAYPRVGKFNEHGDIAVHVYYC